MPAAGVGMETSVITSLGLRTFSRSTSSRGPWKYWSNGDRALAAGSGDLRLGVQRQQRRRRIRRMDDVAQLAADDRVVAIVAGDGVAEVAALLVASEILAAEEPAARPLVDVAAQRAEVADQRRGDAQRGLDEQRELLLQLFALDDLGQRRGGADVRAVRARP